LLAHVTPVGWNHLGFSDDFLWEQAAISTTEGLHDSIGLSNPLMLWPRLAPTIVALALGSALTILGLPHTMHTIGAMSEALWRRLHS
jgi:hypothetical protein